MPKFVRLSLDEAAAEFAIDRRTLRRCLNEREIVEGPDKKFSILQCHNAIGGDLEAERIRETRHKANLLSMEEDEKRGVLVNVAEVKQVLEKICVGVKAVVQASHLLPEEQDDILKHLQSSIGEAWKR